jgi:hypothetical protein
MTLRSVLDKLGKVETRQAQIERQLNSIARDLDYVRRYVEPDTPAGEATFDDVMRRAEARRKRGRKREHR